MKNDNELLEIINDLILKVKDKNMNHIDLLEYLRENFNKEELNRITELCYEKLDQMKLFKSNKNLN